MNKKDLEPFRKNLTDYRSQFPLAFPPLSEALRKIDSFQNRCSQPLPHCQNKVEVKKSLNQGTKKNPVGPVCWSEESGDEALDSLSMKKVFSEKVHTGQQESQQAQ